MERGSFPNWADSIWGTRHRWPMRNASCTTIAPTGSISIIARCSSGIEPIYSLACRRRALGGREFLHLHPLIERIGKRDGWLCDSVHEALLEGVPPTRIRAIPLWLGEVLVTAPEISPDWHVRMQAVFQKNVDNAVSKTVNLSADTSVEEVDRVLRMAFKLGCKGITVYRDGSRPGQTLSNARESVKPTAGSGTVSADAIGTHAYAHKTEWPQDRSHEPGLGVNTKNRLDRGELASPTSRCADCIDL